MSTTSLPFIPVSLGELIDKMTILELKIDHLSDNALANVIKEYDSLSSILNSLDLKVPEAYFKELKLVNSRLWDIEDKLREMERIKRFDEEFVSLARQVYQSNDKRAEIKRQINLEFLSEFVEEKSYEAY